MKYGVTLLPTSYADFRRHVRLAESVGFDYIGVADSQSLFRELFVSLTVAALDTERVQLGPSVTNPLTRHPAVMASAIASLHELSGGRAFLGIGTGIAVGGRIPRPPNRLYQHPAVRQRRLCRRAAFYGRQRLRLGRR